MKAIHYFTLILFLISFSASCQKSEMQTASPDAKRYILKGKVVAVDKAKKKATVKHDKVSDYMEAMTMDFPVSEDWVWEDLTKDAEIRAELVIDKDRYWLEKIVIIAEPNPNQPAPPPVNKNFAQIGKEVPRFTLTNQDGKRISTDDFRGKALAITFIYSRCPLPEYCTLMSRNFSDVANQLKDSDLKDKIRLLSVSFDPQTDTPQKLKAYGQAYFGKNAEPDFSVWQLASGTNNEVKAIADFFGLRYEVDEKDKTQFNHSLRTIVITPEGKVQKEFTGNEWTSDDLLGELRAAVK